MKKYTGFGFVVLLVGLLMSRYVASPAAQIANDLPGTQWQLVSINGDEVIPGSLVTLEFQTSNEVTGNGGCNSYGSVYQISDNALTFQPITRTMMACDNLMQQEELYLDRLEQAARYEFSDVGLTIFAGDNTELVFAPLGAFSQVVDVVPAALTRPVYYLASDEAGTAQVYQILLDGDSDARQLTRSTSDVLAYGVAHDGLSVTYISGGQLWLQPIHTEEPEALAPVNAEMVFGKIVYSPDNAFIAYPDDGVWLFDLATRDTRQILQNVPLNGFAENAQDYRIYLPEQFVSGADGAISYLVVDIGIWEWNTAGIYNLETDDLQEVTNVRHTDLLALQNGQALIYGNSALDGQPVLHVADNLSNIDETTQVADFSGLIDDATLFAQQAVEIAPGTVRVIGPALQGDGTTPAVFYFDYDLIANAYHTDALFTLPDGNTDVVETGSLSPDGSLLPVYVDVEFNETGIVAQQIVILDIVNNTEVVTLAGPLHNFQWQP